MFLRQATASQSRMVGQFIDDTDFKTAKTGLTIANTDVKLNVNGAAGVNKNSGGGTHRNNGFYSLTFDATDTATVGELAGTIVVASALPVPFKFFVVEEAVYDAIYVASAPGYVVDQPVNTTKVGGTSQTAGDIKATLTALFTTALTESYNADGAAPTVAQALFLMIAFLMERSISSTTLTAKKLDGSTSAATFTLNDATTPTAITRAT